MVELTIIVPIYNVEKYLCRCIDSILAQTFADFELILVNDASPDNCGEICNQYAEKDTRIKIIHKPNGGVSSARNAGLDVAKGDYIAFVDSDDWIHPCYFEFLMKALNESGTEAATLNNVPMTEYNMPPKITYSEIEKKEYSGDFIRKRYYDVVFGTEYRDVITCGLYGIYQANIFEGIRFNSQILIGEDLEVMTKISARINSVVHLSCALYYYFIGNESAMRSEFNRKNFTSLTAIASISQLTKNPKFDGEYKKFEFRYAYDFLNMAYKVFCSGEKQLKSEFEPYRLNAKSYYINFKQNTYLTFLHKICIFLAVHRNNLWKSLFIRLESSMMIQLNNFLKK